MIELIKDLSLQVSNIVMMSNSSTMSYIAQQLLMDRYIVSPNYVSTVSVAKDLRHSLSLTNSVPLQGNRWLVMVNVDKIGVSDCLKFLGKIISTAVVVYLCNNYRNYKQLIQSDVYKQQFGTHFATQLYLSRLNNVTVDELYSFYMRGKTSLERKQFKPELMKYLKKNYRYNPDLVCDLFSKIKSGSVPYSEKDIIEMVGVGGNTPQAFTISLLTTTTHTESGCKRFLKKNLMLLSDLATKYSYDTVYSFMLDTLRGIIDIKSLQISGRYFDFNKDIPESYNDGRLKRLSRLKRFEDIILNRISLRRVLNLMQCMTSDSSFDKEGVIIQGLYEYVSRLG